MKKIKGFTLIELIVTITVVIVLSSIATPLYKSRVKEAKLLEGYALLGAIRDAQLSYKAEYRNFLEVQRTLGNGKYSTTNMPILGIDARANRYFTLFNFNSAYYDLGYKLNIVVSSKDAGNLTMIYNLTSGVTFY